RTKAVPGGEIVADRPETDVAARIVAPQHVRDAVAVEVADPAHRVRGRGRAKAVPRWEVVADRPVSGVAGRVVAPQHVRGAVAVEVARRARHPWRWRWWRRRAWWRRRTWWGWRRRGSSDVGAAAAVGGYDEAAGREAALDA